jgi:hypothetical protein
MFATSTAAASRELLDVLVVRLGDVTVALEAACVSAFVDCPIEEGAAWNLARFLGLPDVDQRVIAVLKGKAGYVEVYLGEHYSLQRIPMSGVQPVPRFLAGLETRCGIVGVFELEKRIAYLFEYESLVRAVSLWKGLSEDENVQ